MALSTTLLVKVAATESVAGDLQTATAPLTFSGLVKMATGTAAGLADRIFTDTRTLAASGTESLDLAGSLVTPLGQAFVLTKLKAVIIRAAAGNTNDVQVTRPASNGVPLFMAASDGVALGPGGVFAWASPSVGVTVTAATADLLTITNSAAGTPVTYDVILIGTSA
jgi:hypothetical protein